MKVCACCKQTKSLPEFCRNSRAKDGKGGYCKECRQHANKRHYAKNAQKYREQHTERYVREKERLIAAQKAYYQRNKESVAVKSAERRARPEERDRRRHHNRSYYAANRNQFAQANKAWWSRCTDKGAYSRRRRARKRDNGVTTYKAEEIYGRDNGTCQICLKPVDLAAEWPDPHSKSLDHIVPICEGGEDSPANVRLTHLRCNLEKGRSRG